MRDKPFLMGSETEYSVSVTTGQSHQAEALAGMLLNTAADRKLFPSLPDANMEGGIFLSNGARLYNDINGHPEYCTPECLAPEEIAAHDKVGELILRRLADEVKRRHSVEITVTKNNLTSILPDTATFGTHESYVCWQNLNKTANALIPHLVSRLPYAGSGCLSAHPDGLGFELSQRARHLVLPVGSETTHDRAIFCTRVRKSSDTSDAGWTRAHLIAKDSQRAPLGIYLTFGTTGLLFWILNHGGRVGENLQLADPVQAMRSISLDPWLKTRVPLADGRLLTALEIQRCYLAECRKFAAQHRLPAWGERLLHHWSEVLTALEQNPLQLAPKLDTYAKLVILQHAVHRAGLQWQQVRDALQLADALRRASPHPKLMHAVISGQQTQIPQQFQPAMNQLLAQIGLAGPHAMEHLKFVLRLQVLDIKYHELGGVYDQLAGDGHMESVVVSSAEIERATTAAPRGSRAEVRANLIAKYQHQSGWCADWPFVVNRETHKRFDLRNPFESVTPPVSVIDADPAPSIDNTLLDQWRRLRRRFRVQISEDDDE